MEVQLAPFAASPWAAAVPQVPPPLQGTVRASIAGYRLERRLAHGRRSDVWLAQDLRSRAPVALKLASATSFAAEFAVAQALAHPNVLRVLEHGIAQGLGFLAMEHAAGGALSARLAQPAPPARAVAWLRQAATALAQLHERGLVHRDVKAANFLLRADDTLVLADFGLTAVAGTAPPAAAAGAVFGTPRYLAPEQLRGAPAAATADVYSLGVLLHELLCGRPPFPGETLMEVLSQHLVAPVPQLPSVLAGLQRLADAMLAKDASARLPDARAVLQQLDGWTT